MIFLKNVGVAAIIGCWIVAFILCASVSIEGSMWGGIGAFVWFCITLGGVWTMIDVEEK